MTESKIARIWLLLVSEGGRWKPTEIASELGLKRPHVYMAVNAMQARGSVERYGTSHQEGGGYRYGVAPGCVVPQGVRLDAVQEALGGVPQAIQSRREGPSVYREAHPRAGGR